MLPIFERSEHLFSPIRVSASKPNQPINLLFTSVGYWEGEPAFNHINCDAMEQRIQRPWGRFQHIIALMFGPSGECLKMVLVF